MYQFQVLQLILRAWVIFIKSQIGSQHYFFSQRYNPQYSILSQAQTCSSQIYQTYSTMINDFMKTLCESVKQKIINKTQKEIKRKAQAIGIKEEKVVHWQRFYFLICQHIAYYIDQHVQIGTDKNSIPFVLAVFVFHNIVDFKFKVWSSVSFIKEMEKKYRQLKTDEILQVFKPNQNITIVPFERQFSCLCNNKTPQFFSQCQKCLKSFHPSCQYQKLVCNKCYLTNYLFPIDWTFYNRFGEKYNTQTYFHGKFKTYNNQEQKKVQLIAMQFEISDFADLQNAQEPQLWIKIMNFSDLSHNNQNQQWKNQTNRASEYSMILNSNRFEFYVNFEPLRRKFLYFRNENSLIFKLQNRLANEKDNVLMIVCHLDYCYQQTYEIGVFRMTKATQSKYGNMMSNPFDKSDEKSFRLSKDQYNLLQKYSSSSAQALLRSPIMPGTSEKINLKKEKMKMNESESESENENEANKKLKLQLVRSYGCIHKQGFNYYEMKRHYDKIRESCRPVNKKSQKEKSINERLVDVKRQQRHETQKRVKSFKNKGQEIKKEEKKYGKFLKCPICFNHMMSLYLLPFQAKQGEEMRNIHLGLKKKVGVIKSAKFDDNIFETKKPIFPMQKKEEQDDEDYSRQEIKPLQQQSNSDNRTIVQSVAKKPVRRSNDQNLFQSRMLLNNDQCKALKCEPIQDFEEREMAFNSQEEREFHFQKAAQKIFSKKDQVMSDESRYSIEEHQVDMIQVQKNHLSQQKIVQELNDDVSCQAFQPTEFTYIDENQKKQNNHPQSAQEMNKKIIAIFKQKNQIHFEPSSRQKPVVSLLSEDQESDQIRPFYL